MKDETSPLLQRNSSSFSFIKFNETRLWRISYPLVIFFALVAMVPFAIMQNGLDNPEPIGAFMNGALPEATPGGAYSWTVVDAFDGLTFNKPMTFLPDPYPGSNKVFVSEREGKVYFIDNDSLTAAGTKTLALDITERVAGLVWDGGLLNMCFHPRFGVDSNFVYLYYCARIPFASYPTTAQGTGYPGSFFNVWGRLSRFTVDPVTSLIDASSEIIMINKRLYNASHRGGGMTFANDGFLYLAVGDEFRYETAQDMESQLEGGVLRIDVNRDPTKSRPPFRTLPLGNPDELSGVGYFIPFSNPFIDSSGTRFEEYYSLGHRNPHRLDFDSTSNKLWLGEVGGNAREEVDIIDSGHNYGYPFREGTIVGSKYPPAVIEGTLTDPVAEFQHNTAEDMGAIIGGFVYRGSEFPGLTGKYICGGHGSGEIWSVDVNETSQTSVKELIASAGFSGITSFGTDHSGEVYLMRNSINSKIYKMSAVTAPGPPALLSQVGAFTDLNTMSPALGVMPYDLNEPFWSDHAIKSRWVVIPNDGTPDSLTEQILYQEEGDWEFPIGTVLIKHFEIGLDDTNPAIRKKLETRFMVHGTDGKYYGITYKWNSSQTDAVLLNTFAEDTFSVATSGFPREEVWFYPGRASCLSCHNEAAKGALGPLARQLNKEITYPATGRFANQIITLEHINFFSPDVDTTGLTGILTSKNKYDATATLESRARTYLDANCSSCHMPGTDNRAGFDARLPLPLAGAGIVYGDVLDDLGIEGARIVIPGDTSRSVLYQRLSAVHSDIAMPPLAKNKVDTAGVRLIGEWIMALDPGEFVQGTGLEGSYYNNDNFTNLVKTQIDPKIDFFWGVNGPPGYTNSNQLSIRWTGQVLPLFNESYTFSTYSDDGVRLWVNGQLLIDDWFKNGTVSNSGAISLIAGQKVDITLEYLQGSASALVELSWESQNQEKEIIPSYLLFPPNSANKSQAITLSPISDKKSTDAPFSITGSTSSGLPLTYTIVEGNGTIANLSAGNIITLTGAVGPVRIRAEQPGGPSGADVYQSAPPLEESFFVLTTGDGQGTGLSASYFHDQNLSVLAFTRIDPEINFGWGSGAPDPTMEANTFSVRWQGEIEIPVSGTYSFVTSTDDGVRLWIDSSPLIDEWQGQSNTSFSGNISLPAGKYPIVMEYYDDRAYASARLEWTAAGLPLQVVPQSFLYPTSSTPFPVEFLNFDALVTPVQEVALVWLVSLDGSTEEFEIERSRDGLDFSPVGAIDVRLDQAGYREYEFLDTKPFFGNSYYRIRQLGVDGEISYSRTRIVRIEKSTFSLYPNPVGQERILFLEGEFEPGSLVEIYTASGQLLFTEAIPEAAGASVQRLDLSHLPGSVYYVKILQPGREFQLKKILLR